MLGPVHPGPGERPQEQSLCIAALPDIPGARRAYVRADEHFGRRRLSPIKITMVKEGFALEIPENLERFVRCELDRLCIPPTLRGHRYLSYMVAQVAIDPERIQGITKDLYRETARRFRTTWSAVARSSWAAVARCWGCEAGRVRFCRVAGRPVTDRPAPSMFVTAVAQHVKRSYRADP